jgi:hypothetical protein
MRMNAIRIFVYIPISKSRSLLKDIYSRCLLMNVNITFIYENRFTDTLDENILN